MTDGWTKEMVEAYARAVRAQARMNDEKQRSFYRSGARYNVKLVVKSILRMAHAAGIQIDGKVRAELVAMARPVKWPPEPRGGF